MLISGADSMHIFIHGYSFVSHSYDHANRQSSNLHVFILDLALMHLLYETLAAASAVGEFVQVVVTAAKEDAARHQQRARKHITCTAKHCNMKKRGRDEKKKRVRKEDEEGHCQAYAFLRRRVQNTFRLKLSRGHCPLLRQHMAAVTPTCHPTKHPPRFETVQPGVQARH